MKLKIIVTLVLFSLMIVGCSVAETASTPEQPIVEKGVTSTDPTATPASSDGGAEVVSFQKDVVPLFQGYCVNCHGVERISRGLDLRTYESAMKGSQNGAMIIPGDAANSPLVKSILSGKMPKRGPIPAQADVDLLIQWINQGAINN